MIWEKWFLIGGFIIAVLAMGYVSVSDNYHQNTIRMLDCSKRGGELIIRYNSDSRWICGKVELLQN